jgi:GNAT superfamily N-acetyltransferase
MQIENLNNADIEELVELQPEGWPDITIAFQYYLSHAFCNPIKITIDKKIVGIGCSILFEKSAWLAHIIVDAKYRQLGIGAKIVNSLLAHIKECGIDTSILIATEMGEPVYLKAGFETIAEYCFFKRETAPENHQISTFIQPYRTQFHAAILHLDAIVSGENRERLLQPYLVQSLVFVRDNVVQGFYIPSLGEGPIYAESIEAGKELMRLKYENVEKASLPIENQVAVGFLKDLGFVQLNKTGKRMVLGNKIDWKPEMIYSRIGGNLG